MKASEDHSSTDPPSVPQLPTSHAAWYSIHKRPMVSIEHPYIIKNYDRGVESLGGAPKLEKLVQDDTNATASLYLRPGNRMSRSLHSYKVNADDVLLKITVPKRTGLKRRRGTQGPYHEGLEDETIPSSEIAPSKRISLIKDAKYLLRSLDDNQKSYHIDAVGSIGQTHRFRGMPDFVQSSTDSPFMAKMKEHILPFDYEKAKGFKLDMSKGLKENTDLIPPPKWSPLNIPYNYSYRQNSGVKQVLDAQGNTTTYNIHNPRKVLNQLVPFDVANIPTAPSSDLAPLEVLEKDLQGLILKARELLEDRPIYTRRALANCMGHDWEIVGDSMAKHVYQYVGYIFGSGPWRDAIVTFGVDPRKDPKYRIYQTMMFMLETEAKDSRAKYIRKTPNPSRYQEVKEKGHFFDGKKVSKDGKVWQVIDITDPLLKCLLATNDIRKECHIESDGWYHNGTWAKAKIIMKAKISTILTGAPALTDTNYTRVIEGLPDVINLKDKTTTKLDSPNPTPEELHLASSIRAASALYRPILKHPSGTKEVLQGDASTLDDRNGAMDTDMLDAMLTVANTTNVPEEDEG